VIYQQTGDGKYTTLTYYMSSGSVLYLLSLDYKVILKLISSNLVQVVVFPQSMHFNQLEMDLIINIMQSQVIHHLI